MIPTTAQEFIDALRRWELLNRAQLEAVQVVAADFPEAHSLAAELVRDRVLTQFQAEQVLQGYAHELTLGPYRLLEVIGEGGMGTVFKALEPRLNRVVALKMIRDDLVAHQPEAIRRFKR